MRTDYLDDTSLEMGQTCIIVINDVNRPTGTWWGTISDVYTRDNDEVVVKAVITGGPFLISNGKAIKSNEHENVVPHVNYDIYPDTKATRNLFHKISETEKRVAIAKRTTEAWSKTHMITIAHLLKKGVIPKKNTD